MTMLAQRTAPRTAILAALALPLALAACGGSGTSTTNSTLYSVHQPVVERQNFSLDLIAGPAGLSVPEQARLADWFEAMDVGYGDRIAIDDASGNPAVEEDVAAVASRHSLLLHAAAPLTQGHINPGYIRVVVSRSTAQVPGCPEWENGLSTTLGNRTSPGYGCATNSNLAAMIADPEHLLEGVSGSDETVINTSTRAIEAYRGGGSRSSGGSASSGGSSATGSN